MGAYWIGTFFGAVLGGFLWSRLWLWISKLAVKADPQRLYVSYAIAWVTAVALGAYGLAEGGPPDWPRSLLTYTPALLLWLVFDLFRLRGKAARVGVSGRADA